MFAPWFRALNAIPAFVDARVSHDQRHWDQIVKVSSIQLSYEEDFVLRDLLDVGMQNYCPEIEEVWRNQPTR